MSVAVAVVGYGVICFLPASPIVTVPAVISAIGPVPVIVIISVPAASVVILVFSLVYRAGVIITAIVGALFSDSLPFIIISPPVIIAIPVITAVGWSPIIVVAPSPPVLSLRVASLIRFYWRRGVGDRCYRWRRITCAYYLWRVGDLCGLRPLFYLLLQKSHTLISVFFLQQSSSLWLPRPQ